MSKLPYICLHSRYYLILADLSERDMGKLFRALLEYNETGISRELTGKAGLVWPVLRQQYEIDLTAYNDRVETNRRNGRKGGRPRKGQQTPTGKEKT